MDAPIFVHAHGGFKGKKAIFGVKFQEVRAVNGGVNVLPACLVIISSAFDDILQVFHYYARHKGADGLQFLASGIDEEYVGTTVDGIHKRLTVSVSREHDVENIDIVRLHGAPVPDKTADGLFVFQICTVAQNIDKIVFFVHCREPKEIQKFVDILGAETLIIRRKEIEELPQSNHADEEVLNFKYTYTIKNNSNIEELEKKAIDFINKLVKF